MPALWRYAELREQVMEAGRLITAEEAERRVLILENPALRGQSCITQSLYAGLQLIMPGEVAPAHRHSSRRCAWCWTARAPTPRWTASARRCAAATSSSRRRGPGTTTATWATEPVVWLDGLDIPIVRFLDAGFAENSRRSSRSSRRAPEGDALARYGNNMVPLDYEPQPADPTRVFVYPFERTRAGAAGDRARHAGCRTMASSCAT